ncbi:amino acid transporter AVT1I-like isoform X1 [Chenopodium quinoa]|uniref:amino acid transporter AVT1I-like isoform X1 n=1 Tax=Chenopodium quinoa TaxID=63459 RepID=UPI000B791BFF|nr:amino acid transporter AVT1I-like isoform X1 [Chenopodium quinoa]
MCSILSSKLGWLNKVQPKTTILDMPSFEYQPLLELEDNNKESSLKESNTSFLKTVFNGINVILGNGILIVPYALAHGGWLSLILFIAIAAVATYTSLLLKWCMDVDPRIRTYSHIGEYAFGNAGKVIVSIVLYVELYMVTTSYLISEGDNLNKLFPGFSVGVFGIPIDGKSCFIVIVALILLPTVLLDSLSILAYISAVGVLASLLILGSVLWVGVFEGIIGFHQVKDHVPLFNWKGIPTAISLYMFCFSGQTVIPTVYISMQKKHHFSTALLLSFTFSAFVYVSMAVLGCLMFGSSVESQITLNLPTRKLSSEVAIYTTLITPLVKYALILKPVVVSTEGWFPSKYHNGRWFKYIVRLTLVATQVVIALALPFFGYLMSLMGALLCSVAALTIPCLCYLKISSTTSKSRPAERFFIWCIVCLSLVLLISGTYTSILDILVEITQ